MFRAGIRVSDANKVRRGKLNPRNATEKTVPDFHGGAVIKNLPANAGNTGSSPGPGRSHMPWSN